MAVFWAHSDIRSSGFVQYHVVDNSNHNAANILKKLIKHAFPQLNYFTVELALIVTWNNIGYWENGADKVIYFLSNIWTYFLLAHYK